MIQNITVTKLGSEADDDERFTFSSETVWESGGENLLVYKNGLLLTKNTDYTVSSNSTIVLLSAASKTDTITLIITKYSSVNDFDPVKLDRVVKKIEGKAQTSIDKNVWEEAIPSNLIIHADDVWASTIETEPSISVSKGVAYEYNTLTLTQDSTVADKKGWYASTNSNLTGRISKWIPPSFGIQYTVRLYDSTGTEIPSSSAIGWKWDYSSGYLFIENAHNYSTPFKVKGYVYTGEYVGGSDNEGSYWKSPATTESALPSAGNVDGDVRLVLDANISYRWNATTSKWVKTVFGSASFRDPVVTFAALPIADNTNGDLRLVLDTNSIYRWTASSSSWVDVINAHNHDGRYYLKSEIDAVITNKSDEGHNHDTLYYRKTEVDAMVRWRSPVATEDELPPYTENLDGDVILTLDTKTIWRFDYYAKPQGQWVPIVEAVIYWKAPVATYADLPTTGNNTGDIRLVESDSNSYWWNGTAWQKITGISDHNHDDLYYRKEEIKWKIPVSDYSSLPATNNIIGDVRLTLDNNNIYEWDGSNWKLITASPRWREPIGLLVNLPTNGNIDGDCRVVTETACLYQWNTATSKWIAIFNPSHTHNDLYYTKTQLDAGQLDNRYYTETEINTKLSTHTHNGTNSAKIDYSDLNNIPYIYWKNPVVTKADLPLTGNSVGDTRIVLTDADIYTWNGALWDNATAAQLVEHNHDDLYYRKAEITALINQVELWTTNQLALKASVDHNHDTRYYTKAQTDQEIAINFDVKTGHDHDGVNSKKISYYDLDDIPDGTTDHNHDDLYYRKTELQIAGESEVNWDNVINKPDLANGHWKSPVQTVDDLPKTDNTIYDIRLVLDDSCIYEWSGYEWVKVGYWENRYIDYWKPPVDTYSNLPVLNNVNGDIRLILDENTLYRWDEAKNEWIVVFSSTYNLQVYLNGDLLQENIEYVRIKEQSIKLKFNVEGGLRLTIVITGQTYIRTDFTTYAGQTLFEINNRYKRFDWYDNLAGRTVFTMTSTYAIGTSQLLLWLNGDLLKAGDDFTERSTMSFQMAYPLNGNDRVTAIILDQKSGDGEYTREDQYAAAGQVTFTLKNYYQMGSKRLLVYYNGLLLKVNEDYSEETYATIKLKSRTSNSNDHLTFIIFGSNTGIGETTGASILLGTSSDGSYLDGLLDLESSMYMNDAIDDINEALLDLAPASASDLSGLALVADGLTLYSGYVSAENVNYESSAGAYHSYLTENNNFYLYTPDGSFGDAEKGTLDLYINDARVDTFNLYGAFVQDNINSIQSASSYGICSAGARQDEGVAGTNGAIRNAANGFISIMSVGKYNNFKLWQSGRARINITASALRQGYNYISLIHSLDTGDQIAAMVKLFLDTSGTRPSLETDISYVEESMISSKYCSGIRYYSIGDSFRVGISAYRMFANTYSATPMKINLTGMTELDVAYNDENVSGPQNPPRLGDFFDYNGVLTLDKFSEYSTNATLHVETFDPFSAGAEAYSSNTNTLVNTYINSSTDLIEYFHDEVYRLPIADYDEIFIDRTGLWDSKAILTNGNAMIYDLKLEYPNINFSGYKPVQTANYSVFSGDQVYLRSFYKRTAKNGGSLTLSGVSLADLVNNKIKVEIKLPSQTGWLLLNKNYDVSTFTGADGDGCYLNLTGSYTFNFSTGTFSTANSGFVAVVRITLPNDSAPKLSYMEMGW